VFKNEAGNPQGKRVQLDPRRESVDEFLLKCSSKLGIKARKIFDQEGAAIDELDILRDEDVLYISQVSQ